MRKKNLQVFREAQLNTNHLSLLSIVLLALFLNGCASHNYIRTKDDIFKQGLPNKVAVIFSGNTFWAGLKMPPTISLEDSLSATEAYSPLIESALSAKGYQVTSVTPAGTGYCVSGCKGMLAYEDLSILGKKTNKLEIISDSNAVAYEPPEIVDSPQFAGAVKDLFLQMTGALYEAHESKVPVKSFKEFAHKFTPNIKNLQVIREHTGADMVCFSMLTETRLTLGAGLVSGIGMQFGALGGATVGFLVPKGGRETVGLVSSCIDSRSGDVLWQRYFSWSIGNKRYFVSRYLGYFPEAMSPIDPKCTKTEYENVIVCPNGTNSQRDTSDGDDMSDSMM